MERCKVCFNDYEYDELEWGLCVDCREELEDITIIRDYIYNAMATKTETMLKCFLEYYWGVEFDTLVDYQRTIRVLKNALDNEPDSEVESEMRAFVNEDVSHYYDWFIKERKL